jgi:GTPase SAR1 family protein
MDTQNRFPEVREIKESQMAISLKSTGGLTANGVKLLVYGAAGSGKTTLIKKLPNVIVLSA